MGISSQELFGNKPKTMSSEELFGNSPQTLSSEALFGQREKKTLTTEELFASVQPSIDASVDILKNPLDGIRDFAAKTGEGIEGALTPTVQPKRTPLDQPQLRAPTPLEASRMARPELDPSRPTLADFAGEVPIFGGTLKKIAEKGLMNEEVLMELASYPIIGKALTPVTKQIGVALKSVGTKIARYYKSEGIAKAFGTTIKTDIAPVDLENAVKKGYLSRVESEFYRKQSPEFRNMIKEQNIRAGEGVSAVKTEPIATPPPVAPTPTALATIPEIKTPHTIIAYTETGKPIVKMGVDPIIRQNAPITPEISPTIAPQPAPVEPTAPIATGNEKTPMTPQYRSFLDNLAYKINSESKGQSILDELSDTNKTSDMVANEFWNKTYHQLPDEIKNRFDKMAELRIGNIDELKGIKQKNAGYLLDLGGDAENLEGTERGFVSLMEAANRAIKTAPIVPETAIATPKPEISLEPTLKPIVEQSGAKWVGIQKGFADIPDTVEFNDSTGDTKMLAIGKVTPENIAKVLRGEIDYRGNPKIQEKAVVPEAGKEPYQSKIFNKPQTLEQEALKYKTAEEFVNSKINAYHGSANKFDKFSYKNMGTQGTSEGYGFYFTDKKNIAQGYYKSGGSLKEAYVKIDKPLSLSKKEITKPQLAKFIDELDKSDREMFDGEGGGYLDNWGDIKHEGRVSVLKKAVDAEFNRSNNDVDMISSIINASGGAPQDAYPTLKKVLGYDGIIEKNPSWGKDVKSGIPQTIRVAFDNNQIIDKSQLTDIWNKAHAQTNVFNKAVETPTAKIFNKGTPDKLEKVPIFKDKEQLLIDVQRAIEKTPDIEVPMIKNPNYEYGGEKFIEAPHNIPLISFKMDGGAKIYNTKKSLQQFYDRVKKTPEAMTIPDKIPSIFSKPKPKGKIGYYERLVSGFSEVKGRDIKIVDGLDTFLTIKKNGAHIITEGRTGMQLGEGIDRARAIEDVKYNLDKNPNYKEMLAKKEQEKGLSPSYEGIEGNKIFNQPKSGGVFHKDMSKVNDYIAKKGLKFINEDVAPKIVRLTQPTAIKDIHGITHNLKKGEEFRQYELSDNKTLVQDGERFIVSESKIDDLNRQGVVLGKQEPFGNEFQGLEETAKGSNAGGKMHVEGEGKPRESAIITAVGRALGEKESQIFAVKRPWNNIVDEFYTKKITTEDSIALGNYYDNPNKYPLSKAIKTKLGEDLIAKNLEFKKFLTQEQKSRGLLDTEINDEEYLRTFLTQENGEPPTPAQLYKLLENSSPSIQERLMGINNPAGGGGLSFKNKFNQSRKFENADLRDEYLKRFGLKTDRNYVDVMRRTVNQVTKTTSNYDFVKSLRQQAKDGIKGVKEIYDPKVFKDFKDNLHDEYIDIRDKILTNAKEAKMITEAEYLDGKRDSRIVSDVLKHNIKINKETPNDLKQLLLDDIEIEYSAIKEGLFADFKGQRETFNYNAKQMIGEARNRTKAKIVEEVNKISAKYADALTAEYRRPKDMRIAQQMTGLMFDKTSAASMDKIFEILKPSSLEDTVRAVKLMLATGDLFQLPEIVRQRFGVNGMKGLAGVYKYTENEFYTKGIKWVKRGLILGKPADMDIELIKKMGQTIERGDVSVAMKIFNKAGEIGSKIPIFNKAQEGVVKVFMALEDFQWKIALPHTKLDMCEGLAPAIAKNNPHLTLEESETLTAQFVNDTFQGLNWDRIMAGDSVESKLINKSIERASRILLFGSDRFLSLVNRYTKGFGRNGAEYRKFWIRSAIAGITIAQALNYFFNGKSTLENQKGNEFSVEIPQLKDQKGNPMAINVIGTWQEPFRILDKPGSYLLNKQGTLTRMLGFGQPDWAKPKTLMQFLGNSIPMPFTLQNIFKQLTQGDKPKAGQVDFETSLVQAALEFAGFPTTFRSGKNKQARLTDLLQGNADPFQYLTSQDIKPKGKIFNKNQAGRIEAPIGNRMSAPRMSVRRAN